MTPIQNLFREQGFCRLNQNVVPMHFVLPSSYMGRSNYKNTTHETSLVLPRVSDVLTLIELSNIYQALNDSVRNAPPECSEVANLEHLRAGIDLQELQQTLNIHKGILHNTFKWHERLFIAPIIVISAIIIYSGLNCKGMSMVNGFPFKKHESICP